jgi:hypothetical protein
LLYPTRTRPVAIPRFGPGYGIASYELALRIDIYIHNIDIYIQLQHQTIHIYNLVYHCLTRSITHSARSWSALPQPPPPRTSRPIDDEVVLDNVSHHHLFISTHHTAELDLSLDSSRLMHGTNHSSFGFNTQIKKPS